MDIAGIPVTAQTEARLRQHLELLVRWNAAINLVAASTLPDAWNRHIVDSAQLLHHAPTDIRHWVDLGSGAGFPGLVVAAILADQRPDARVTLIESDRRKATFLRETARVLGLTVTVRADRIETVAGENGDVVSARALAPVVHLIPLAQRHLAPGGVCLFLKGARVEDELALAARTWSFSAQRLASVTDATAEILRLKGLAHV